MFCINEPQKKHLAKRKSAFLRREHNGSVGKTEICLSAGGAVGDLSDCHAKVDMQRRCVAGLIRL